MNINQLEQKLAQRPLSPLFARLAHEYISANRVDAALNLLRKGVERHTDYSTAYFALAECYLHGKNLQEALDAINHAVHMNPAIETLQQVRREIITLYNGSTADESGTPIIDETVPPETETAVLNAAETDALAPAWETEDTSAGTFAENGIVDSPGTAYPTADVREINAQEESNQAQTVEKQDESIVAEELAELLQTTEVDNLPPMPDDETFPSVQEIIADEENKITAENAPILSETSLEAEKLSETFEEVPATAEIPVESVIEAVPITGEFPVPDEQVAHLPEISGGDITAEAYDAPPDETKEEAIVEPESPVNETSLPPAEENRETVAGTGTEKVSTDFQSTESLAESSEAPKYSDETQITTGPPPELPDDDYRIVSKTLAEIYVSQGEYGEALLIYRLLKHQKPVLGEQIDRRIEELENLLRSTLPNPPQT